MVANVNVAPMPTTNAAGTFRNLSDGYIQGFAMDDPAIRNELAGGILSASESLPMWGGVGIAELIPSQPVSSTVRQPDLGGTIRRATGLTGSLALTGFSVFDQAHHMVQTPQSPVPVALSQMSVNFYRLGCGARIAVAAAPSLVSLQGGIINPQVSWDFGAQRLVPYSAAYSASVISGAVWASTGGGQVTFTVADDLTSYIDAGDYIVTSGVVNTGGTSTGAFNGSWKVKSITSSTIVVEALAGSSIGTYASGGTVNAGGGALPVKVLDVKADNNKIVSYDPLTGYVTWNDNGPAALILI